uniref:Uncharacterized protein n=1 Tax=Ursus maritimus TaxID=29073 RepID=A0A452TDR3_URSMA
MRPKRKVHSPAEAMKEEARRGSGKWPVPASARGGMKPKQAAGKDESSDRKAQTKGKRGAEGKQAEVANQKTKRLTCRRWRS